MPRRPVSRAFLRSPKTRSSRWMRLSASSCSIRARKRSLATPGRRSSENRWNSSCRNAMRRASRHIDQFSRSNDIARTIDQRREVFGVRKNGEEFPAEASISKLDLNGELVFTVILRDVTDRRRAEEDLRRSRNFRAEASARHTGSWAWISLSDAICSGRSSPTAILGFDRAQGVPSLECSFERIHSEDRPVLAETIERAVREKAGFQIDYRLLRRTAPGATSASRRSRPSCVGRSGRIHRTVMDVAGRSAPRRSAARTVVRRAHGRDQPRDSTNNDVEPMTSGVMQEALDIAPAIAPTSSIPAIRMRRSTAR